MPDLVLAVQLAVRGLVAASGDVNTALNAVHDGGEVPQGDRVWQHIPLDAAGNPEQPPMVIIGELAATPAGGKGGGLDRIEFELMYAVRKPGREYLTPLMTAGRAAVEGIEIADTGGVKIAPPVFEGSETELLEDGETYFGVQRFSTFAQEA